MLTDIRDRYKWSRFHPTKRVCTRVEIKLLKKQRNWLLKKKGKEADGLINLLDDMLDLAEK